MTTTVEDKNLEIGSIEKGKAKIKVSINTFKGKTYLDVRTFLGDKPTTKGVSVPLDKIGQLITLVEQAEAKVTEDGLS